MKQFHSFAAATALVFLFLNTAAAQPTPICYNGLSIELGFCDFPNATFVSATDFDAASFSDDSQIVDWQINKVFDTNRNQVIDLDELRTEPPGTDSVVFDLSTDLPITYVQFWVIDQTGAFDYCLSSYQLDCEPEFITAQGQIVTEDGIGIEEVPVKLNGRNILTDANGYFGSRTPFSLGADLTIVPFGKDNILEGVTEEDLKAISDHILNRKKLNSPYKVIAADINRDGKITVTDILILRKLMQGTISEFPKNTSWRFIKKDFIFAFPDNPNYNFAEFFEFYNLQNHLSDQDFIGIKIGDVVR